MDPYFLFHVVKTSFALGEVLSLERRNPCMYMHKLIIKWNWLYFILTHMTVAEYFNHGYLHTGESEILVPNLGRWIL